MAFTMDKNALARILIMSSLYKAVTLVSYRLLDSFLSSVNGSRAPEINKPVFKHFPCPRSVLFSRYAFTHRGLLKITGKYFSHLADKKRGLEVKLRVEKLNCLPDSGETAPCKKTELLI